MNFIFKSDYGNGSPLNDSDDDDDKSPVAPPPPQITDRVPIVLTHEEMVTFLIVLMQIY